MRLNRTLIWVSNNLKYNGTVCPTGVQTPFLAQTWGKSYSTLAIESAHQTVINFFVLYPSPPFVVVGVLVETWLWSSARAAISDVVPFFKRATEGELWASGCFIAFTLSPSTTEQPGNWRPLLPSRTGLWTITGRNQDFLDWHLHVEHVWRTCYVAT